MLYLATMDYHEKMDRSQAGLGQIHSQLEIYFEERLAGTEPVKQSILSRFY